MPIFKTGHQPKTHMASESKLTIVEKDRKPYEQSVHEPNTPLDEVAIRAAITAWAEKQAPGGKEWIYSWN